MQLEAIGAIGAGLVWGWLAAMMQRRATRARRTAAILFAALTLGTAQQWWQASPGNALVFGLAALAAAMGHGAWIEGLRRRANTRAR